MFQIPQVSLFSQESGIEHMTKFMRKQAADNLVAVQSAANLRDDFVAAVDLDDRIVRAGYIGIVMIPVEVNMDPAIVLIASCLCRGDILKVTRQDPGSEKLPICDLASLLIQKLPDLLVTDSCHRSQPPYQEALRRFGAKIGSRIAVRRASRSSSSEVALLMMVESADL